MPTLLEFVNILFIVQSLSHVQPFATPWTVAVQASLSFINFWSLLKLTSFESMMLSNHLSLCRLLLLMPPVFASIRVFSNESALHIRWPKYWNFSFSLSPSNGYSWLISFITGLLIPVTAQKKKHDFHSVAQTTKTISFYIWQTGYRKPDLLPPCL